MYKEIFIALCLVAIVRAYPAENTENEESIVELVQVEPDTNGDGIDDDDQSSDLAVDESRYGYGYRGHRHHHHHHHHGGYRGGYGGYGYGGYRRGGHGGYWG